MRTLKNLIQNIEAHNRKISEAGLREDSFNYRPTPSLTELRIWEAKFQKALKLLDEGLDLTAMPSSWDEEVILFLHENDYKKET